MTQLTAPLTPVVVTTVACSTLGAVYGLLRILPSPLPILFITIAPLVSVVLWVQNDAGLHRLSTVHDWGLFVYLFWPVLVPMHVFKTRGSRGWTLALLLLAVVPAPLVVALAGALAHDLAKYFLRI